MKHVLFALIVAACTSDPTSARSTPACAPPAVVAPVPTPPTLEIRKHGIVLAHLAIAHGTVGTLTLALDSADAHELRDHWHRIEIGEQRVHVEMHETTPEGGRGALATWFYQPKSDNYITGVRLWLTWEQGYEVRA